MMTFSKTWRVPVMPIRVLIPVLTMAWTGAEAHVFTQPYALPVPFAIYAVAATAALLLSFVMVGVFAVLPPVRRGAAREAPVAREGTPRVRPWVVIGRGCSVGLLLLSVVSGFLGSQNAFININMTLFWIGFVLVVPYAVALVGDFYASINPWKAIVNLVEVAVGQPFRGRIAYPARFGEAPALLLYMAFIWLELFGQLLPRGLAGALSVYTLINIAGAYSVGTQAWFRHGEFFGVFLRLMGRMSPRARPWGAGWVDDTEASASDGGRRWRLPFTGLVDEPVTRLSGVLFILFMLSSTAFDGLHSTLPWVSLYWGVLHPALAPWLGPQSPELFRRSTEIFYVWQWLALLLSPFAYLMALAAAMRIVKAITRTALSTRDLVLRFAMSLIPIAFVYHLTHYYTLVFAQGGQLWRLASDPLGWGWNLFGTGQQQVGAVMLDVGNIWLTQVTLIVVGHVAGVYVSHLEALRIFPSARQAAWSQLPMLVLMMLFTNAGLWILSLPIAGG
jgi:hypothetical protein